MIRRKIEYKPAAGPASMVHAGGSPLGANAVLGPGKMPIFVATPGVAACGILAATSKREGASARRSQQAAGPRPRLWPRGNGPTGGAAGTGALRPLGDARRARPYVWRLSLGCRRPPKLE